MSSGAPADEAARALGFRVGSEHFRVPAEIVREVTRLPRATRVPNAPASLLGLANFRGTVLPVVSFAELTDRDAAGERRAIVLDAAKPLALAVDAVSTLGTADDAPMIDIDALIARDFHTVAKKTRASSRAIGTQLEETEDSIALVAFAVAGQDYALPIGVVQEILRLPPNLARFPHGDEAVIGSIGLRDGLLPLLSLRSLLALPGERASEGARIVVAKIGVHRVGLVVDAMQAILRVPEAQIDPVPAVLSRGSAETRIQAICRLDDGRRLVSVLAAEHLVREDLTARLLHGAEEERAEQRAAEEFEQLLMFRIGEEEYGLPIASVVEVVRPTARLTRLPNLPAFVQGVRNLRGEIVPVIDQAARFGHAAPTGARQRVIVVRLDDLQGGFAVDEVTDVARVPVSAFRPAPDLGGGETRMFERVANLTEAGRIVLIVGPRELLAHTEREMLAAFGAKISATAT